MWYSKILRTRTSNGNSNPETARHKTLLVIVDDGREFLDDYISCLFLYDVLSRLDVFLVIGQKGSKGLINVNLIKVRNLIKNVEGNNCVKVGYDEKF